MADTPQYTGIFPSIPSEKHLFGPENAGNTINRDVAMAKDMEVIVPKLVFDEKGRHGPHQAKKTPGIDHRVQREVTDDVSSFVVFPHLVTGR